MRVDRAREELLAGAALALDEHGHVGARDARHHAEDFPHHGRVAQDVLEACGGLGGAQLLLGVDLERLQIRRPPQDDFEIRELDRLLVVVERAELDGADRVVAVAVAGEDDHLRVGRQLHDLVQRLQPLLGAVGSRRQPEVQADDRRALDLERRHRLAPVLGEEQGEIVAQRVLQLRPDGLVVINDQQLRLVHVPSPIGSLIECREYSRGRMDRPPKIPWNPWHNRSPISEVQLLQQQLTYILR